MGRDKCFCGPGSRCLGYCGQEKVIATFDSKETAKSYIENAKLKVPTQLRNFKAKSLLIACEDAWVDVYEPEDYPHEPRI